MNAYGGGWLLFFCQQQMPGTVVSSGQHLKKQHSCLLSIWALDRKRREKQKTTMKDTGNRSEEEQKADLTGMNRGDTREEDGRRNKG